MCFAWFLWLLLCLWPSFSLCVFHPLCAESLYGDSTDKPLLDCCACGTAKYRVTFYGNWSEKTHPKDYPRRHNLSCFFFFFACVLSGNPRKNNSVCYFSSWLDFSVPATAPPVTHIWSISSFWFFVSTRTTVIQQAFVWAERFFKKKKKHSWLNKIQGNLIVILHRRATLVLHRRSV